jgi:hypothetical protein
MTKHKLLPSAKLSATLIPPSAGIPFGLPTRHCGHPSVCLSVCSSQLQRGKELIAFFLTSSILSFDFLVFFYSFTNHLFLLGVK